MPVRNSAKTIGRALTSLLEQSFTDIEIVVSDNCSDDETAVVLGELAARDPRVRCIRQQRDIGMIANFEHVVAQARGEYFMWAAGDDYWHPDFIEELVSLLRTDPGVGVAMSSVVTVDEDGSEVGRVVFEGYASPAGKPSWWVFAQMINLIPAPPLHYFIYGVFRRPLIEQLMARSFPRGQAGDRVLMSEVALATRMAASPRLLHARTIRQAPLTERYAEDDLGQAWRDPAAVRRYHLALLRRVTGSRLAPLHRRVLVALPLWTVLAVRRRRLILSAGGAA